MTHTFIIKGQLLSIESLDPSLDQEFVTLHSAFLSSTTCRWDSFVTAAHAYLSQPGVGVHQHEQFFKNFTILWRNFLGAGQFDAAERIWNMACAIAWDWERANPGRRIHKGTPYYFWGMTALRRGDIDRGYALMHQALEEDVLESGQQFPTTPALALVTMNAEQPEQAAFDWVAQKAQVADRYLKSYRQSSGMALDFSGLNVRFLQHPPNRHTVYSLSYVLGRLSKLFKMPAQVVESEFAAQLNMDLIFRLLQVLESALKAKNPTGSTFFPHAVFLAQRASLNLTQPDLSHVNAEAKKDFEKTLCDLLDGVFALPSGRTVATLARDLAVAYVCRNYGAHQLSPVLTVLSRAEEIKRAVFNTLFLTIETLY